MLEWTNSIADAWWQWMGPMLVQVGLLVAVVAVIDLTVGKRLWPQLRLALWGLIFVKLVVPPTATTAVSVGQWLPSAPTAAFPTAPPSLAGGLEVTPLSTSATSTSWAFWAFAVWGVGVVCLAARRLWQTRQSRRLLVSDSHTAPDDVTFLARRAAREIGLRRLPRIIVSHSAPGPAVFGLLRPTVVVPAELIEALPASDLENVLLHELAHVKRRDLWWGFAIETLGILYWLQPLLWWGSRRVQTLREVCCDATVVRTLQASGRQQVIDYRRTLLRSARHLIFGEPVAPASAGMSAAGFWAGRSALLVRLEQLQHDVGGVRRRLAVGVLVVLLLVTVVPMGQQRLANGAVPTSLSPREGAPATVVAKTPVGGTTEAVVVEAVPIAEDPPVSCWTLRAAAFQMHAGKAPDTNQQ